MQNKIMLSNILCQKHDMILALIDFLWIFLLFFRRKRKNVFSCKLNRKKPYFCYELMQNKIMLSNILCQKHEKGIIIFTTKIKLWIL